MSESRSLRGLLAVNTVLVGGLLWTIFAGGTPLSSSADAAPQYRSSRSGDPPPQAVSGVGNAAARQRDRIIKSLEGISKRLDSVEKRLGSGDLEVNISNVDDLAIDYGRLADAIRRASSSK